MEVSSNGRARQRAICIAAPREGDDVSELVELLRTAGVATVGELVQRRERPHPNTYLGPGKVDELNELVRRADANLVACDDELSPRQERNLEQALGVPVIDRTAIILDIFAGHAHSSEGKLQVELAQLEYNLARMRGLWTHLERLGAGRIDGGIGTRGPGETQIETDRRLARDRITALRRRLERVSASREVMRAERERAALPTVALVGYTNAGKSTLLNRLTSAGVLVEDQLFSTLDPTTRKLRLPGGETVLLTDTVGFVRKLPHQLVEAFRSTLEDVVDADLLVHVVDGVSPTAEQQIDAVREVLREIGAADLPELLVVNKLDVAGPDAVDDLLGANPSAVAVSAVTGEGVDKLREVLADRLRALDRIVELAVPYERGDVMAALHRAGEVLVEVHGDRETRVRARIPDAGVSRFAEFVVGSSP